jgi:serine/threonine protein phosphatase PrpC
MKVSNGREHVIEQPASMVAGVSDKGIVHPRNEDAAALAADPDIGWAALVVCDGVTTAADSDVASLAAVNAARALLAAAPRPPNTSAEARIAHWSEQLIAAAAAANRAATETAHAIGDVENPPSATFVAAVADRDVLVAAWIGDSRAYWLPEAGPAEQLSVDDSWATAQINIGVSRDVAEASPQAHAITRWIGPDGPSGDASTSATTARSPGWLMVCSDGLWNYCSEASELAKLVYSLADSSAAHEPLPLAESLVTWANEQGGHDNITVALAFVDPTAEIAPTAEIDPTASEVEMKESF